MARAARQRADGNFDERMAYLGRSVGKGIISAVCDVNQPYAQDQHETPYRHAEGRSRYLGGPLYENRIVLLQGLARQIIDHDGSDIDKGMIDIAEKMAGYVLDNAPVETARLATSAHPKVESNGRTIYERPPLSPRAPDVDGDGQVDN